MIYWLGYFSVAKGLQNIDTDSDGFKAWFSCLSRQTNYAVQIGQLSLMNPTAEQVKAVGETSQEVCAYAAEPWVPNFVWAAWADVLPAVFGIVLLGIFGSRMELWKDLKVKLFGEAQHSAGSSTDKIISAEKSSQNKEKSLPPPPRPKHIVSLICPDSPLEGYRNLHYDRYHSQEALSSKDCSDGCGVTSPARFSQLFASDRTPGAEFAYRTDTPEAWKPRTLLDADVAKPNPANTTNSDHSGRSLRVQLMTRPNSELQDGTPLTPPPHRRFYNTEDFNALPIFLATPPPTYNPDNDNTDTDEQLAIVSAASRVRLNYRESTDAPRFEDFNQRSYHQSQEGQQVRSQRGESLPAPPRPRNPLRYGPLRASSPASPRTHALTRNEDLDAQASIDVRPLHINKSNLLRNESLRANTPNMTQNESLLCVNSPAYAR
ncbi:hypothetical protein BGX27_006199 [Mortierella sp. AM989]|nr:hypothetical protein BGX27_006199 [Mortierella sp. AM989]